MLRFYLIGFALLVGCDSLAQISFKHAANDALPLEASLDWAWRVFSQPWIYGAFVGYIGSFFAWMTLLRRAPIGPAYAASHLDVVAVMLLSMWVFGEEISLTQVVGAALILAGIGCFAVSESRSARKD